MKIFILKPTGFPVQFIVPAESREDAERSLKERYEMVKNGLLSHFAGLIPPMAQAGILATLEQLHNPKTNVESYEFPAEAGTIIYCGTDAHFIPEPVRKRGLSDPLRS